MWSTQLYSSYLIGLLGKNHLAFFKITKDQFKAKFDEVSAVDDQSASIQSNHSSHVTL